jgi:aromatic-L-amino-acid decarboxylase
MKNNKLFLLEESSSERKELVEKTVLFGEHYFNNLSLVKAYHNSLKNTRRAAGRLSIDGNTIAIDEILSFLDEDLLTLGLNTASRANMGYIPGEGIFSSALGDYIVLVRLKQAQTYNRRINCVCG